MRSIPVLITLFIAGLLSSYSLNSLAQTRIWQEEITLPTYLVGDADPNPRFYDGRVTQGAQGRVYPYAMSDVLLQEKEDKVYDIIYLENDYVKISVIPELGGRIFTAVDKSNQYDFFYRQHVIKPALIGTLGEWVSGGSEWNFPHHHKATTMKTMDYLMEEHDDGSATLWLAETERRHRFRITLSIRLYADRSYVEMGVNPYNPTPFVNSFLYFANPAVHVDSTYQVIFPPNVAWVTQHAKREFIQWPVANGHYGGKTYEDMDISWWKNLASPVSFFAWNESQDFFAGYDHGKKAGVAYVANHHTAPGMKFFTFGSGEEGKAWDKRLTDSDGPYLELMAGVFSDNQPDYSWSQPYESKMATQYWYPVRDMGGMEYANENGAVHLDVSAFPKVSIRLNTTSAHSGAFARLSSGEEELWSGKVDLSPAEPWSTELEVPEGIDSKSLEFAAFAEDSSLLMEYSPVQPAPLEMPQKVSPPQSPEEIASVEELYLAGLRIDQFYNAQVDPMAYYKAALEKDPGNYAVNVQLGILACKGFRWEEAKSFLSTAVERITSNHTRPKDGEAWYYLGIALRELGEGSKAYDAFYRSSWSQAWHASSYYQLAEMDCQEGDYSKALDHINRSISTNFSNLKARNLKTVIHRKSGQKDDALLVARYLSMENPLDLISRNELRILEASSAEELLSITRGEVESIIEMAAAYGNWGCPEEANELLSLLDVSINENGSSYPMLYYYMAYNFQEMGDVEKSGAYLELAAGKPSDYCFPYRMESLPVLEFAINRNPGDGNAYYYLGNMLFDHQPLRAKAAWEKAAELDFSNPVLYRNLGWAYEKVDGDYEEAIESYLIALELSKDPRVLYELDLLLERANVDILTRESLFDQNVAIAKKRVDALMRQVLVYVQAERYDEAIDLLQNNYFYRWEGGNEIRYSYEDAHQLRGLEVLSSGKAKKALPYFEAALEYPENLEEGRPEFNMRFARSYYYLGLAFEEMGELEKAMDYYRLAADEPTRGSEFLYYNYLAHRKLSENVEAEASAEQLVELSEGGDGSRFFAKFGGQMSPEMKDAEELYMTGLSLLVTEQKDEAKSSFEKAVQLNPNHSWAKVHLEELSQ